MTQAQSDQLFGIILFWLLCGVVGAVAGGGKRMGSVPGFFLGLLLGPIGVIIVLVSASRPVEVANMPKPRREVSIELAALAQLRKDGELSDEEFAAEKARLLGRP